jgi:flagellar assembly protein FliH
MSFIIISAAPVPDTMAALPQRDRDGEERRIAAGIADGIARLRITAEAEGRSQGEMQARKATEHILAQQQQATESALSALQAATEQLMAPLARKENELAGLITDLALSLAEHILGVEVSLRADSVEALVRKLLIEAVEGRKTGQSIIVRLHPDDHLLLAPKIAIADVHLLADSGIARGGTMIELLAEGGDPFDRIAWDAMLETRIATIRAAMSHAAPLMAIEDAA